MPDNELPKDVEFSMKMRFGEGELTYIVNGFDVFSGLELKMVLNEKAMVRAVYNEDWFKLRNISFTDLIVNYITTSVLFPNLLFAKHTNKETAAVNPEELVMSKNVILELLAKNTNSTYENLPEQ